MDHQLTIAGQTFGLVLPYKEGDVLSANEASALNQTFAENIRNNMAKKVEEGLAAGVDHAVLQAQVADYAEAYEFGVRSGGGGRRDPVQAEAVAIAVETIKNAIKSKGYKLTDFSAKDLREKALQLIAKDPRITEMAKDRVEQQKAAAREQHEELDSLIAELQPQQAA